MIINGYKLKASDYPIRRKYYESNPTTEHRAGESMSDWVKNMSYDVKEDPNNKWKRKVTKTPFGQQLKSWGYKMPSKPKKSFSIFSIFSSLIAPLVKEYFDSGKVRELIGGNASMDNVKIIRKIISPITMYRMLFMKMIERSYFFELRRQTGHGGTYKEFKKYVKDHPNEFWVFFANYLKPGYEEFKESKINLDSVAEAFVKGDLQLNGSDPDDAIVFLLGVKNIEDNHDLFVNGEAATTFLEELKGERGATDKKMSMTRQSRMKTSAQKSQKEFFETQVQYLFENEDAFQRYNRLVQRGINPIQGDNHASGVQSSPIRIAEVDPNLLNTALPPPEIQLSPEQQEEAARLRAESENVPIPEDDNDLLALDDFE
jgi:hypothetical protein